MGVLGEVPSVGVQIFLGTTQSRKSFDNICFAYNQSQEMELNGAYEKHNPGQNWTTQLGDKSTSYKATALPPSTITQQ